MDDWREEALDSGHRRDAFSCGKPSLDDFLKSLAGQYERRGLGRTYVAVRPGEKNVLGYYTLAAGSLEFAHLPAKKARKLPKHPVPVILLGRLAVDRSVQGQGLGALFLSKALARSLDLSRSLGVFAVEVAALDSDAKDFYLRFGFSPLADNELHLYLPITTIEAATGPPPRGG